MFERFRFRMFDINHKKMYNPENVISCNSIYECLRQQVNWDLDANTDIKFNHIAEGMVFMQCTGLKDHTGKLIYEGDIVKLSYNGGQIPLFSDNYTESPEPDIFLVRYSEDWQAYFCCQLNDSCPMAKDLSGLHTSLEELLYPDDADVKKRVELNHAILVNDYDKYSQVIGNMYENEDLYISYIKKYGLSEEIK